MTDKEIVMDILRPTMEISGDDQGLQMTDSPGRTEWKVKVYTKVNANDTHVQNIGYCSTI